MENWSLDDYPPHLVETSGITATESRWEQMLEKVVLHHLAACEDCQMWAKKHDVTDYHYWQVVRD